ncbi:MAG: ABC transporter ATP-binding protein [Coriobacteriales bacterium]|jgi:ATP-binding cassette subfamily B protein|nr:ABC transporter ATP-binding protein [Coriobacteriales bacterium]
MLKLRRFLKPFVGGLLVAICLLFIQAICELNLPNLMSDIVNVGIQQGGVQDDTPRAMSKDGYDFIYAFSAEDDAALLDESFELVPAGKDSNTSGTAAELAKLWPKAAESDIYVLKPQVAKDNDKLAQLDSLFGTTTWTILNTFKYLDDHDTLDALAQAQATQAQSQAQATQAQTQAQAQAQVTQTQAQAQAGQAQTQAQAQASRDALALDDTSMSEEEDASDETSGLSQLKDIDLTKVYKLTPVIGMLDPSIISDARASAQDMDNSLREQSATMLVTALYTELGTDMGAIEVAYIVRIGAIMLAVTILSGLATVFVSFFGARIGAGVARNLRKEIFKKVSSFSHTEFDRFSTASLITRSTNDISIVQMLVTMGTRFLCYAPIMGIGGVIMALQKSTSMSWIIGVAVVFIICLAALLLVIVMPKFKIMQTLIDRINLVSRESLNGLMVIRAFSRTDFETARFEDANAILTKTNLFVNRAMTFMMPVMMIFMNGLTVLIIWVGAHQVAESQMQVGDMMAYMQYVMMIMMAFMTIVMMFVFIPRASVSAGRINEVLETEPVINDPAQPVAMLPEMRGIIQFDDVSFRYSGAQNDALEHISFTAMPGQTTAFIGSTGSGKTSIVNLIMRFYDVTAGTIRVGGVDVRNLAQAELRSHIGYVPQKSALMAGTIASNIAFGNEALLADYMFAEDNNNNVEKNSADCNINGDHSNDAACNNKASRKSDIACNNAADYKSDDNHNNAADYKSDDTPSSELQKIAEVAQALGFINEKEDGFNFAIAQGGSNVSGGQRQRLSIARALALHPDIYLFDDSFSALDFSTDAALRKALRSYTGDSTMIVVAQRVSTIMDADQILVVDDGCIVGRGTHNELINNCPAYREIASSQGVIDDE